VRGEGRLVIQRGADSGFDLSEPEVVRTIYRMCSGEKKSCQKIADHLNRIAIPCSTATLNSSNGKRNRRTGPIWDRPTSGT
jgi:hypothetical protein